MKKQSIITILLTVLMSMVGAKTFAQDVIAVENTDGVTIYYRYINDGKDLEVGGVDDIEKIVIPGEVTYMNRTRKVVSIGENAFNNHSSLISITIPNSVVSIRDGAFWGCKNLLSITIPQNITNIGMGVFGECSSLSSITIPNNVTSIGQSAFLNCKGLTSVTIPNSVTYIGEYAFNNCNNLTSVTIPNSVTYIGKDAFWGCSGLTSITIPNSVTYIGEGAFSCENILSVISKIEDPFSITGYLFSINTFYNGTLYVPVGTVNKYKEAEGWNKFLFIEEETGPDGGGETPETKKCATPTIGYQNGKLMFNCDTEGATCHSIITDTDITSYSSNEVQLGVTYNISVYATKNGYENSDVATATLCWIDVEPKTEGITNIVSNVRARAVLIQSNGNQLTISGTEDGTTINVFDISGRLAGSTKASSEITTLITSLHSGDIGIVKIGDKAVKVLMK